MRSRPAGLLKTDKRDALGLANRLYNQLEKGIQVTDRSELVRRAHPPTATAAQLRGLIDHRSEPIHESTRRCNKLTAIYDQLFPECTQVFTDPNGPTALAIRDQFPTPEAVATASPQALCAAKGPHLPGRAALVRLQELATASIGVRDLGRQRSLVFEQAQLIRELRFIRDHLDQIDAEVAEIVDHAREGRILQSIPGVGVTSAAAIIAAIGNIHDF